jgi:hypothetical protein
LEETGHLDYLGKPGEQLYAARFFGNRGYLVTFRRTDPLYVLDLSDPGHPVMTAALELPGFSDYLHPIGEDWVLGIGLDSLPATDCQGFTPGQLSGVKLSLFDVTDASAPREVDSLILPGTDTNVRQEHLALAYLPPAPGLPARLALPIQLSDNPTGGNDGGGLPGCGFTQAGLYVFDLALEGTPRIRQVASLITDRWPQTAWAPLQGNRSLLLANSAHYLHAGSLTSGGLPAR